MSAPKWEPIDRIHEDRMPYLLWDINDLARVGVAVAIDDYDEADSWTHCLSVRQFFMRGFDPEIDSIIMHGEAR